MANRWNLAFDAVIKKLRITDVEIEQHVGWRRNKISDWRRRDNGPSIKEALQIAEMLGLTLDELFVSGSGKIEDSSLAEIRKELRSVRQEINELRGTKELERASVEPPHNRRSTDKQPPIEQNS